MAPRSRPSSWCSAVIALAVGLATVAPQHASATEPAPDPVPVQRPPAPAPAPASEPAPAPTPAPEVVIERVEAAGDEVILRDGSFVRGSVVELTKGQHVIIELDAQNRRQIAWSEIERVRLGQAADPAPAAEPAPQTLPASAPVTYDEPAQTGTRVHIEPVKEGQQLTLYRINGGFVGSSSEGTVSGIAYEPVCAGSCDKVIDGSRGHDFFVGGDHITPSRKFRLDDGGRVTLRVKGGNRATRIGGVWLVSFGAAFLLTGLITVPFTDPGTGLRRFGVGMSVGGGISLVAGIPLMIIGRTVVEKVRR